MKLRHLFIPHTQTHKRAHLIHWHSLLIYLLLFVIIHVSFDLVTIYKPGVLGVNSTSITVQQIIDLTNVERQKQGLTLLKESPSLDKAAAAKAQNMFDENYWAHFSPSGKDPWGFINASGYRFSYAGENLARNFYTSDEVVKAWMASPTHKANLLNPHYQDIGIAVVDGVLLGQKTTLIVQEFGRPADAVADTPPQIDLAGKTVQLTPEQVNQEQPSLIQGVQASVPQSIIDPFKTTRVLAMFIIGLIGSLILIDFVVLKRRGVYRFSSHHFVQIVLLIVAGTAVMMFGAGSVL